MSVSPSAGTVLACRLSGEPLNLVVEPGARYLAAFAEFYDSRSAESRWRAIQEFPEPDDPMFGGPSMPSFSVVVGRSSLSLAFE